MSSFRSSVPGPSGVVSSNASVIHLESGSKSSGSSRGLLSHPAILLLIAAAVLFTAYALGYVPQFGSLLEAANRTGPSTAVTALGPVFYGIASLVAFLLLLALLRSFDMLLRRIRKTSSLANRPVKSLAQFLEEAAAAEIGVRVARESYHLLQPHYPHLMCIDLGDRLREDLGLEEEQIQLLDEKLFALCDRRARPSEVAASEILQLVNVFDLLLRVEKATPLRTESPSGSRARSIYAPVSLPTQATAHQDPAAQEIRTQQSRNPTSAQRKALHAAALHAIESRSLRVAQTSGLRRRSSDYDGPRRRATDNPSAPNTYRGPYRRSQDLETYKGTSSSERKLELVPTKPKQNDPRFMPTLDRRRPEPGTRN